MTRWAAAEAASAATGLLAMTLLVAGCAAPVILENPATHARVNCTADAERQAAEARPLFSRTGHDVPRQQDIAPGASRTDYEQQCVGHFKQEGYVCVSGCR